MEPNIKSNTQIQNLWNLNSYDDLIQYIVDNVEEKVDNHIEMMFNIIFISNENLETELQSNDKSIFKRFKDNLDNQNIYFYNLGMNFFFQLDYRSFIYEKIVTKPKVDNIFKNIINMLNKLKIQKNYTIPEIIKKEVIMYIFTLNTHFLKSYIDFFEIKDILYSNKSGEICLMASKLNDMIYSQNNFSPDFILKIIHFSINFLTDEKIKIDSNFVEQIDSDYLFNILLENKSYFNYTKRMLKIFPERTDDVIKYLLSFNETKQSTDLAKDKELNKYVSKEVVDEIIYKANIKSFEFFYGQFYSYKIDLIILSELYIDKPDVLPYFAYRLINDNLFAECYYLLKLLNFNLQVIKLDDFSAKKFMNYLSELDNNTNSKKMYDKRQNIYLDEFFLKKFEKNKQIILKFEDFFGPVNPSGIKIDLGINQIIFVDNLEVLSRICCLLDKIKYIGFDSEWKPMISTLEKDKSITSIMQLAIKKNVFILDILKFTDEMLNKFKEMFKDKTFIGFGLDSDIASMSSDFKRFFTNCNQIDIADLYKEKYKKKCPSLSELCVQLFKTELCKYEQMSNWEIRPLRLRQLHYAALDAHILLSILDYLK